MEKINIARFLKSCPSGMELDCTSYDNVSFDKISDDKKATYPIFCYITDKEGNRSSISFTENGCESKRYGAKCVIFPKGKTTWEGFVPPCKFKDGDVLFVDCTNDVDDEKYQYIFILNKIYYDEVYSYCYYSTRGVFKPEIVYLTDVEDPIRFATEEEKEKLFDVIKENGYCWNPETKVLEKLPRFKVGDKIKTKYEFQYVIKGITDTHYTLEEVEHKYKYTEPIIEDKNWELVPNKFDINTLKPFDKVLVRCGTLSKWRIQLFEKYDKTCEFSFICLGSVKYKQCIPYEGNEHLLDTTYDCTDFYKTW